MSTKRSTKRGTTKSGRPGRLTDYQLVTLTDTLCGSGEKEEEERANALLILVDEIGYCLGDKEDESLAVVKRRAFSKCGDDSIQAHITLVRSEYPG